LVARRPPIRGIIAILSQQDSTVPHALDPELLPFYTLFQTGLYTSPDNCATRLHRQSPVASVGIRPPSSFSPISPCFHLASNSSRHREAQSLNTRQLAHPRRGRGEGSEDEGMLGCGGGDWSRRSYPEWALRRNRVCIQYDSSPTRCERVSRAFQIAIEGTRLPI
jgi:hypothetical protein